MPAISCSAQPEKMPRHVLPFSVGPESVTHAALGKATGQAGAG